MNPLRWIAIAALIVSCAHGKMGKVDLELKAGALGKSTLIYIEPVSTKGTLFSGDKSADAVRVAEEKAAIAKVYSKRIAAALRKRGYNAKATEKPVQNGLVLQGDVTRFQHGSAAARIMVGMGAGSSNLFTTFNLADRGSGKVLTKFEVIATSGGSGGLSAAGSFMEAHLSDGADKVAEYIEKSNSPAKVKN